MKPETKRHMVILTAGLVGVTILTLMITLSFFESEPLSILRNVIVANALFLLAYWGWLRTYGGYQKMYKLGLKE